MFLQTLRLIRLAQGTPTYRLAYVAVLVTELFLFAGWSRHITLAGCCVQYLREGGWSTHPRFSSAAVILEGGHPLLVVIDSEEDASRIEGAASQGNVLGRFRYIVRNQSVGLLAPAVVFDELAIIQSDMTKLSSDQASAVYDQLASRLPPSLQAIAHTGKSGSTFHLDPFWIANDVAMVALIPRRRNPPRRSRQSHPPLGEGL